MRILHRILKMSQNIAFPYVIRELNNEEKNLIEAISPESSSVKVKFEGSRACGLKRIRELGEILLNFEPRKDDIWLIGFPRSGTTLTQETLYLLGTDLDYEKASQEIMDVRFPMLETALMRNESDMKDYENCSFKEKLLKSPHEYLKETKEKRFIKSHFGFSFIHPKILETDCKVIFIARNIKDVIVSNSRYPCYYKNSNYTFEKVWNLFKNDLSGFGNYFEMLQEAIDRKDNKNLLILYYEEVNADKRGTVLKIANFLNKKLSNDQLEFLLKHLDIEKFKENKSLNNDHLVDAGFYGKNEKFSFIRNGKSGGWKEVIPKELNEEIDEWIIKNFKQMKNFVIPRFWKDIMELK